MYKEKYIKYKNKYLKVSKLLDAHYAEQFGGKGVDQEIKKEIKDMINEKRNFNIENIKNTTNRELVSNLDKLNAIQVITELRKKMYQDLPAFKVLGIDELNKLEAKAKAAPEQSDAGSSDDQNPVRATAADQSDAGDSDEPAASTILTGPQNVDPAGTTAEEKEVAGATADEGAAGATGAAAPEKEEVGTVAEEVVATADEGAAKDLAVAKEAADELKREVEELKRGIQQKDETIQELQSELDKIKRNEEELIARVKQLDDLQTNSREENLKLINDMENDYDAKIKQLGEEHDKAMDQLKTTLQENTGKSAEEAAQALQDLTDCEQKSKEALEEHKKQSDAILKERVESLNTGCKDIIEAIRKTLSN